MKLFESTKTKRSLKASRRCRNNNSFDRMHNESFALTISASPLCISLPTGSDLKILSI